MTLRWLSVAGVIAVSSACLVVGCGSDDDSGAGGSGGASAGKGGRAGRGGASGAGTIAGKGGTENAGEAGEGSAGEEEEAGAGGSPAAGSAGVAGSDTGGSSASGGASGSAGNGGTSGGVSNAGSGGTPSSAGTSGSSAEGGTAGAAAGSGGSGGAAAASGGIGGSAAGSAGTGGTVAGSGGSGGAPNLTASGVEMVSVPLTTAGQEQRYGFQNRTSPSNPWGLVGATLTIRAYAPGALGGDLGIFCHSTNGNPSPTTKIALNSLTNGFTDVLITIPAGLWDPALTDSCFLQIESDAAFGSTFQSPATVIYIDSITSSNGTIAQLFSVTPAQNDFAPSNVISVPGSTYSWMATYP